MTIRPQNGIFGPGPAVVRFQAFSAAFGHTPLSANEEIPWKCRRLVVGTGADGSLPIMGEVKEEAARRRIELLILPTREAISALERVSKGTNAILHVTC